MMTQNNLADLLKQASRLSTISDKAEDQLCSAVQKWFEAIFVRSMKLTLVKDLYRAGAFDAFRSMLIRSEDAARITILMKLDKHNLDALKFPRDTALAHIQELASGKVKPAPKPKTPRTPAKRRGKTVAKTLIESSNY